MKTIKLVAVLLVAFTMNAQEEKYPNLDTFTKADKIVELKTLKGMTNFEFKYKSETVGKDATDEAIRNVVADAISKAYNGLRTPRSYVPNYMWVKFIYKRNGKHKYVVYHNYYGTNVYGGEVLTEIVITYNKDQKETKGSKFLRVN